MLQLPFRPRATWSRSSIERLFTEASELAKRFLERKGFAVMERQDMTLHSVSIHNYRMAKT